MNNDNKTTCVYFHINPVKNEIFYVGIGDKYRPYDDVNRSNFWHNVTNKYDYNVIIIEERLTWKQACEKEILYIKQIGRRDLNFGTLVNLIDGGDGVKNLSIETRQKMSKSSMGKKMSEKSRKRMSDAKKGNKNAVGKRSEEAKKKMSDAQKGKIYSEEYKKNMSKIKKGKTYNYKHTTEAKKKMSDAKIGKKLRLGTNHSNETKKKISNKLKGVKLSNETKKKMSESHQKRLNNTI